MITKTLKANDNDLCCFYHNDVVYAHKNGVDLHLQIIVPREFKGEHKYPTVVYIQGSAWFKQNCYMNVPNLARFAKKGYVVAIVEYRHCEIAPFPAQIEDAKSAIRFMRKNAEEYLVDTDKILVWGDSSGGHTSLLTGLTHNDNILCDDYLSDYSTELKAIVNYYGVTDISEFDFPSTPNHLEAESPAGMLMGKIDLRDKPELIKPTIAMEYITEDKEILPILTMHGTSDTVVAYHQGEKLNRHLEVLGKTHEFYPVDGADHGGPAFWSDEALEIVDKFYKKYL